MVLGKTNEKVLNQLYIDTAVVDKQLNELFFAATIVDEKLSSRIGIYSAEHPYYIVLPQPNSLFDDSLSLRDQYYLEAGEEETESDIIKSYKSLLRTNYRERLQSITASFRSLSTYFLS